MAVKDEEIDALQQAAQTERIKAARLVTLIQKRSSSSSSHLSSSSDPSSHPPALPSTVSGGQKPLVAAVRAATSPLRRIPGRNRSSFGTSNHF